MSNLSTDKMKRLRDIIRASLGKRLDVVKPLGAADVDLLVERIEELELDDRADAGEFIPWAVERMKEDLEQKRGWLEDAIEQVRMAELCVMEADHAYYALKALAEGGLFESGDEINKRWDGIARDYYARGLLVEAASEAVPEEPAPPETPAAATTAEAELPPRVLGSLSWTKPGDKLTEKQANVFRAILSAADQEWRAVISQGRIAKVSGEKAGGMWAHLDALEKKDYIRILDRGNSTTPGSYLICDRARPAREAPPKSDAELIAEALAAGRVTKVSPPGAMH